MYAGKPRQRPVYLSTHDVSPGIQAAAKLQASNPSVAVLQEKPVRSCAVWVPSLFSGHLSLRVRPLCGVQQVGLVEALLAVFRDGCLRFCHKTGRCSQGKQACCDLHGSPSSAVA